MALGHVGQAHSAGVKILAGTDAGDTCLFNGEFLDRVALDKLLAFAEGHAGSARSNLHLLWDGLRSPLLRVQAAD